ncbi:MAG TPA: hypothetical protein VME24_08400 [Alphaproteobacteria bacterium]|nr:hypothetical protein [Alphaproteobacteria bacterium]
MEQKRKIERWLEAYAKKRRGQAGDPFKLDPATRRMLQNEISRSAPVSEDEDETMSLWELLRKHWLYLLGFAACIFVLAALFLPNMYAPIGRSFHASPTLSMTKNTRQIPASTQWALKGATGSAATAPAQAFSQNVVGAIAITNANVVATLTPPHLPPAALSDGSIAPAPEPASDEVATTAAGIPAAQRGFNNPSTAPEMAPPLPPTPTRGISGAAPEPDNAAAESGAPTPPAAAAPIASKSNLAMNSMPGNFAQTFESHGEISKTLGGGGGMLNGRVALNDSVETAASPSQSAAVLVNFQVSQNGNTIRVVDQDGSVYTGSLEPEEYGRKVPVAGAAASANLDTVNTAGLNSTPQKSESPKMTQFDTAGGNANSENNASASSESIPPGLSQATKQSFVAPEPQPAMQQYYFYVEGTNQTLKQSVVFVGRLLEDLSFASNAQQTFGMNANAALGAAYAQQFMRSVMTNQPLRIEGIAIVDKTYRIQINAASVPAKTSRPLKSLR